MRIALVLILLCGCGGKNFEIADQPLKGTVNGKSWTFVKGSTSSFLSRGEKYFASLYAEDYKPCEIAGKPMGVDYLIIKIPKKVGTYDFSMQLNMTFVVQEGAKTNNFIVTDGKLIVYEITDTTIKGGIHAKTKGHEINGRFEITICKE